MKISEHCFAITGLGFTPPWEVNAGFVVGGRTTLVVDTGPSYLAAATIHGYASNVRRENELVAVNTELHADHLLGNSLFREKSVPIWGHETCERGADALDSNAAELNATIPEMERRARNEAAVFFSGSLVVNPENRISSPKTFDLEGVLAAVIPAPGHTPANMLVHVPADGVLYSGDTVVAGYLPNLRSGGPAEWREWLSALALVRRLAPRVLVPGHGRVLEGSHIEEEVGRIESILRDAIG
jgi:glyoxylase-like metal-dependent hydrolase (beta-lactamase superfamily II)